MKLIERNEYLNQLLDVKDIPDIKVITGVKRAGKSQLMDMFQNKLCLLLGYQYRVISAFIFSKCFVILHKKMYKRGR